MVQPSVGWSYTPYQSFQEYGFYGTDGSFLGYSAWDAARFRPTSSSQAGAINFGLNNNIEAKIRDKSSAKVSYKKVKLIESLRLNMNYNIMADSLRWSNLGLNAFTTLGKSLTITYSSTYSLYDRDDQGRAIQRYMWQSKDRLLRPGGSTLALSFSKSGGGKNGQVPRETSYSSIAQDTQQQVTQNPNGFTDFSMPWNLKLNYNVSVVRKWNEEAKNDNISLTQTSTSSVS